ncbi:MAG TPA: di-heme oxidoredictase family protein [Candidatus Kryptonia bacterium]|nr:di-heme oxidoredictase family protein [Candidatus Kryptonia bacterium]
MMLVGQAVKVRLGAALVLSAAVMLCATAHAQVTQPFSTTNLFGFGDPLEGIKNEARVGLTGDLETFGAGQTTFIEVDSLPELGPIFNSRSCGACHFAPALGGSGSFINEVRVRNNTAGGPVHIFAADNILRAGPQLQGTLTIFPNGLESTPLGCQITSPGCAQSACQVEEAARTTFATTLKLCDPTSADFAAGANCSAERQSTALFGFGLVEAVADSTFDALAASQPAAIRGTVKRVSELAATRVARFGWKDDVATLRGFAADAYLNEIGITNPDAPTDRSTCALNETQFGVLLDAADDPEDEIDTDGKADIDRFADFMRALAPPPQLRENAAAQAGHTLFKNIGCAGCHVENLTTAFNPASFIPRSTGGVPMSGSLNVLLSRQTFHPFGDFLLHDMGALGDGITSGAAGPRMMRTAPLWGVRSKSRLLHDGRAESVAEAIGFHDGQGAAARDAFNALTPAQQQKVLSFIGTL